MGHIHMKSIAACSPGHPAEAAGQGQDISEGIWHASVGGRATWVAGPLGGAEDLLAITRRSNDCM